MAAIHQVLPVFAPRDAIGNHTVAIRNELHRMGIASEIFAGEVMAGAGNGARSVRDVDPARLTASEPTVWLYHASTGTSVAEWWASLPGSKAIDYHNISPADTTGVWEPHVGVELDHGRRQLAELVDITQWALADSAFNESELIRLGYPWTRVLPILVDTSQLTAAVDQSVLDALRARKAAGGADWLCVSRILPHKAQHDVIKGFAAYRMAYDPLARLTLVGTIGSARYAEALNDFIEDLDLVDAVTLTGSITPGVLSAYFHTADVYVSASEHEGFAVPLVEAMAYEVPIVAYSSTAVPETAGDAAVLLDDKSPTVMAAAVHRVVTDPSLGATLVDRGRRRLSQLGLAASTHALRRAVSRILADMGVVAPAAVVLPS